MNIYFRLRLDFGGAPVDCSKYNYKILLVNRHTNKDYKTITIPQIQSLYGNTLYPFSQDGWSEYVGYTLTEKEHEDNKVWFEIYSGSQKIHDQIGVKISYIDDINYKWTVFTKKFSTAMSQPSLGGETNQETVTISSVYSNYIRPFTFLIVDEIGRDGFLVRRIYDVNVASQMRSFDQLSKALNLSEMQIKSEIIPEKYGLAARNPRQYSILPADHALGNIQHSNTPYISVSNRFPDGAFGFEGRKIYVDISQLETAGVKQINAQELVSQLLDYKTQYPHTANRVDRLINVMNSVEGEVLLHGERIPAKAIFTPESLAKTQRGIKIGRGVGFIGGAFTAYDMTTATKESVEIKSVRPVAAETVRQVGGWGGAILGAKVGTGVGGVLGVTTGPGAFITAGIGGIIFGVAGYFGADWVADYIYEN